MKNLCLIALLICGGSFASAQQTLQAEFPGDSGNVFLRLCSVVDKETAKWTQDDFGNVMLCIGYVRGFNSGVVSEKAFAEHISTQKISASIPFCLPEGMEAGQGVRVVLKYIRDNPAEAHHFTAVLIITALGKAYPCPSK